MSKVLLVLVVVVVVITITTVSFAAEYTVKNGDNLTIIAKKTGCSVGNLANLNEIKDPALIFPGQKISYVSKKDLENSKSWAEKRRNEINPAEKDFEYFGRVIKDIETKNIRYSINQSTGLYAGLILAFSEAWESQKKVK